MGMADPPKLMTCRNCGKEESPYFAHPRLQCIATLRAENERLMEALTLAVRWLGDTDDPTETFEDIGEWFRRETGYLRPGKSLPMEMGDMDEERRKAWDAWVETKGREVRNRARAALKGGCVAPNGRTDAHGVYGRMVEGVWTCEFCKRPLTTSDETRNGRGR